MGAKLYLETYEVDTLGDIDVDFTYSIADITDIERRSTSYSKTLVLPSTSRNQKIFGNIFDISVENDYDENDRNVLSNFNPSKQAKAQIFLDNVKIFDGVLRLIKINNKNGDITYETNVFGRLRDILHTLGDKTLAELNFDDYDHTWNNTNIASSWDRTDWVDGANNYVYPLVDYGYTTDSITYPLVSFKPAIFIREILKRIFSQSGFEIVAPFFDTQYFKKLILVTAEKSITKQVSTLLNVISQYFDTAAAVQSYYRLLFFNTIVSDEGFTISNQNTRFTWQRLQTLNTGLNFTAQYQFTTLVNSSRAIWTLYVYRNGSQILSTSKIVNLQSGQYYNWDINLSWVGDIAQNDNFEVVLEGDAIGGGGEIQMDIDLLTGTLKIGNTVPVAVDLQEGDTMKMSYTLPKSMKQRDFLKSIITMHNLYILQDKLQDNVLEIIPYPLFYKAYKDEALDWTNKLDVSQDVVILPTSEITAKEYRIQFDEDTDYWSGFYKAKYNEGYGESRVTIDNDFELDTKTLKVIFGTPIMREEVQGRIMLHLYKVENGNKIKDNFKPRIAYWKPNVSCPTNWILSRQGGTTTYSTYPYAGHLNNPIDPVADLLFGTPKEVYFSISLYPGANLYGAYYEPLITLIGDKDSRVLQGNFYLTPQDIMDLDFRRIIKVGKHFYQLQKVDRFNPIANTTSYVSLFKILKDLQPTDYDFILLETDFYMLQENGVSLFYI